MIVRVTSTADLPVGSDHARNWVEPLASMCWTARVAGRTSSASVPSMRTRLSFGMRAAMKPEGRGEEPYSARAETSSAARFVSADSWVMLATSKAPDRAGIVFPQRMT